jgi:hypothetical protein
MGAARFRDRGDTSCQKLEWRMRNRLCWRQLPKILAGFWKPQHEIEAAAQSARHELNAFDADLAVSIARRSIRIDEGTDQDLTRTFVKELELSDEIARTTPETSTRAIAYV